MQNFLSSCFINAVRIRTSEKLDNVNRKDLLISLSQLIDEDIKYIEYIVPYRSKNNWILRFYEDYHISSIIGKKVLIGGILHIIEDAIDEIDPAIYATYRLHWLTPGFNRGRVEQYIRSINRAYQVESYIEETCRDELLKGIKNGNIRVKLKVKRSEINSSPTLQTGVHKIEGIRFLVTRIGEKPKCLICNSIEHMKKDCPDLKKRCTKCNTIGHLAESCTYSLKVSGKHTEELQQLPDEDDEEDVDNDEKENALSSNCESASTKYKSTIQTATISGDEKKSDEKKGELNSQPLTKQDINAQIDVTKTQSLKKQTKSSIAQSDSIKALNDEKEKKRKLVQNNRSLTNTNKQQRKSQIEQERKSEMHNIENMDTNNESATTTD
jgi:hypothetical protein